MSVTDKGIIRSLWTKLDNKRTQHLERARQCAKLTIPSLLPSLGHTESAPLETPYQSLGARGVNNLASKLLITLFPPNRPFFRLSVDEQILNDIEDKTDKDVRVQTEKKLGELERTVQKRMLKQVLRMKLFEALRLLVATGNALVFMPDVDIFKVYRLDSYVVQRDPVGNVLDLIIKEEVSPKVLSKELQKRIESIHKETGKSDKKDGDVDLFTRIRRNEDGTKWEISQEVEGIEIPESKGTYPIEDTPFIALRWTSTLYENYGRGLVEEYLGDLKTLETLTKAFTEASVIMSKMNPLISPNSTLTPRRLQEAKNGDVLEGKDGDVTYLKVDKGNDFEGVLTMIAKLEKRLEAVFLLMTSVQRDAERVTAEEIRRMAKELEDALGGVYTVLSEEFQMPLVKRFTKQMQRSGEFPKLPEGLVDPIVVTGIDALSRDNDFQKISLWLQTLLQTVGEQIVPYLKVRNAGERLGTSIGIDTDSLLKTEEEFAQEQQAQQLNQTMQDAAPGVSREMVKGVMQQSGSEEEEQR